MSEEEIIKELKIIKETQDIMQHNLDIYPPKEDIYRLDTKQLKAIICLLDLYNNEKEKNKELEQYKKYYQNERNLLDSYISKDKIRTKIKELEREKQILKDIKIKDKMAYTPYQVVNAEILRLQELLEEV